MTTNGQSVGAEGSQTPDVAAAVVPMDPVASAQARQSLLRHPALAAAAGSFARRLHADAAALAGFREALERGAGSAAWLEELLSLVHKLAGAAGVFGYPAVSLSASALEEIIVKSLSGRSVAGRVDAGLDGLLACMAHALASDSRHDASADSCRRNR